MKMSKHEGVNAMAKRVLTKSRTVLRFHVFPEVMEELTLHAMDLTRENRLDRVQYAAGERRGLAWMVNRLLCWYESLTDEDQRRVQDEGEQLFARCRALDPEYRGPIPFGRRTESVFRAADGEERASEPEGTVFTARAVRGEGRVGKPAADPGKKSRRGGSRHHDSEAAGQHG